MASTRALVKRRKAIRNVRKITRTMELIATARFKKALDRATETQAYTQKIAELAADLSRSAGEVAHPLLQTRPVVKRAALLVLGSNRGLCGGYNAAVFREANGRMRQARADDVPLALELSGKRPIAFFRFLGIQPERTYTQFEDKPQYAEVEQIADRYITDFIDGKIDRLDVAYTRFISVSRQQAVVETLLPLSSVTTGKAAEPAGKPVDYEYEPSASEILSELVPVAFKVRLFKCFLDAAVSEQIARRMAMGAATENAAEMIKAISQEYNRARQANITKELAEIIGGAAALE